MKAVVLTRVSSKKQEDGQSLDAQKEHLQAYCASHNLEIIETYEIIESSVRGSRKDFYRMLDFCKKQKETIAILVDTVDRLQRSFKETPILEELRVAGKIEIHFCREGLIIKKDSRPSDIMIWSIHTALAQSYVLSISENVKRSNDFKIENGEFPGAAPLGYVNFKNEQNHSDIKPDEIRAPLILKLFKRYAIGDISLLQLEKYAYSIGLRSKKGNRVSKQNIVRIIDNRFYYGEMYIKGEIHPHNYQPLVSRKLWDMCHLIRLGKKPSGTKNEDIEHLYRGLITCKKSGRVAGVDRKIKKGKEYNYVIYYDETGKKRYYISEKEVHQQVLKILRSIQISDEDFEDVKTLILSSYEAEKQYYADCIKSLRKQSLYVEKKMNKLADLMIEGVISDNIYRMKEEQLKKEAADISQQIEKHQIANSQFRDNLVFFFACKNQFYEQFEKSSSYDQKRQLLKFITRTFYIEDGKVDISLRPPFNWMKKVAQKGDFYNWRE